MSRIGKQSIVVPKGVEVSFDPKDGTFGVKGVHGSLSRKFRPEIEVSIKEDSVTFSPKGKDVFSRALWGTYASHASNMIEGVSNRFEKKLVVEGVGYKVEVVGEVLTLKVGYSHQVDIKIPKELEVIVEKNVITVKGADKELLGGFCAKVRSVKKPEPYKGKGIRYENEVVRRKQGKRAA